MYICELAFSKPDHDKPNYSHHEVDYYAWTPHDTHKEIPNHRLSLRKNLITGLFEVYRRYFERRTIVAPTMIISTGDDTGLEQVAFEGSFEQALNFAYHEYEKYHGETEPDKPCQHTPPHIALSCPKYYYGRRQ